MDFFTAMELSASGLTAQRLRMNVISANLANIHTTKTPEGGPYVKREVVFEAAPKQDPGRPFAAMLSEAEANLQECRVTSIEKSKLPFRKVFNPHHPHADADGYVSYPNVQLIDEMVDMMDSSRAYEANLTAVRTSVNMVQRALEIGR